MDLKQILINYNLCIDNKYLDLYENLIFLNLTTNRSNTNYTHRHHVIPLAYYSKINNLSYNRSKALSLAKADSNEFTVNLTWQDHVKAHCYLALCSKVDWFTFLNIKALTLLGCGTENPNPKIILKKLEKNLIKKSTITNKTKFHNKSKKFIWICNKNLNTQKQIQKNELLSYLELNWTLGTLRKNYIKKFVFVHFNNNIKKIPIVFLVEFLKSGWSYGKDTSLN